MTDMLMSSTKESYNDFAKFYAEHDIDELKGSEIGLLILCEAKEDKVTRLFIHHFDRTNDIFKKDGWWDIFTVTKTPCKEKGFYICKIENFRIDKNGFLNAVVSPEHYLGTSVDFEADAWRYFFESRLFTNKYRSSMRHLKTRYNVNALHQLFKEDMVRIELEEKERLGDRFFSTDSEKSIFIMNKYFNGEITLDEIDHALDQKQEIEILAEDLNRSISRYGSDSKNAYAREFPLLVKKLPTADSGIAAGCYITQTTISYLERKNAEYVSLNLGDENTLLARVEAVLQYWVDVKAKEKEEKKRKRKEQKKMSTTS